MDDLLDFSETLSELCKGDPSAPSVVISWLPDKQMWYLAVHRYLAPFGEGRVVVAKQISADLSLALSEIKSQIKG